jgi:hypothetical protein
VPHNVEDDAEDEGEYRRVGIAYCHSFKEICSTMGQWEEEGVYVVV